MPTPDADPELPAGERARIARRDRERTTRMVVDNAGVRRLLLARQAREAARRAAGRPDDGGGSASEP